MRKGTIRMDFSSSSLRNTTRHKNRYYIIKHTPILQRSKYSKARNYLQRGEVRNLASETAGPVYQNVNLFSETTIFLGQDWREFNPVLWHVRLISCWTESGKTRNSDLKKMRKCDNMFILQNSKTIACNNDAGFLLGVFDRVFPQISLSSDIRTHFKVETRVVPPKVKLKTAR